ncbi:MAG: thioesterase [Eubacterium sp.]|nr:thioesterase [Eubacterium sp.]
MDIGIRGGQELIVEESMLAVNVGSGEVSVLATPCIVTAAENTAAASVKPYLDPGDTTVGTHINLSHSAATPCGMKFFVRTELAHISSNGKILNFVVTVHDEAGVISEGTHQRAIVRKQRFEEKAAAKRRAAGRQE